MPLQTRTYLGTKFANGAIPTAQDFIDVFDSSPNFLDDGLTSYKVQTSSGLLKRFGFGTETAPECPIGIKGETPTSNEMICFTSGDASHKWNIDLSPLNGTVTPPTQVPGFSIDDASSGTSTSRLFIDSNGNTGIGTIMPQAKLHVSGIVTSGYVGSIVENLASQHAGWLLAHADDNTVLSHAGAFGIVEKGPSGFIERLTVSPRLQTPVNTYFNMGVNESNPQATLHVFRSASDPQSDSALAENTGILLAGPIDSQNLIIDSHRIQARTGAMIPGGTTLNLTATPLGLQPLGGDITVHSSYTSDRQLIITDAGLVGIGKQPIERLDIAGAITVGDTTTAAPASGTIRWNAAADDLQVFKDNAWKSLTTQTVTDGFWVAAPAPGSIYYKPAQTNAKVGIGVTVPTASLQVDETSTNVGTSISGTLLTCEATTSSSASTLYRAALQVISSGQWSSNGAAPNVGLYVSGVTGQANPSANLAAVLNGNVVVGNLNGLTVVGDNGTNVLAIQNGSAPTNTPGTTPNTGIQIYSDALSSSSATSVFHLINGDDTLIKLFQQGPITAADPNTPSTGNVTTDNIIINIRNRVADIENALKALGLLK